MVVCLSRIAARTEATNVVVFERTNLSVSAGMVGWCETGDRAKIA